QEVQLRERGPTAVARVARQPGPGDRGHRPREVDPAHPVVYQVADVEVAAAVKGQPGGPVEGRGGGRAAVPSVAALAGAGKGQDRAVRRHFADAVLVAVGDEVRVAEPDGHAGGSAEAGRRCRTAVTGV